MKIHIQIMERKTRESQDTEEYQWARKVRDSRPR